MANVLLGYRQDIVSAVEFHNIVAVSGCQESYMASLIPYFLYKAGFTECGPCKKNPPRICVASHRRAEALANAEACSVLIGNRSKVETVTGMEKAADSSADVIYITEECLMRKLIVDPLISEYGVVILTGLQNRMLSTEILVALLRRILLRRTRLRVLLCFEGGNVKEFLAFFKNRREQRMEEVASRVDPDELSKPSLGNLKKLKPAFHVHIAGDAPNYEVQYLTSPSPNYLDTVVSTGGLHQLLSRDEQSGTSVKASPAETFSSSFRLTSRWRCCIAI